MFTDSKYSQAMNASGELHHAYWARKQKVTDEVVPSKSMLRQEALRAGERTASAFAGALAASGISKAAMMK